MPLKQNLAIQDFHITRTPDYVSWEELERVLGKRRYKQFMKWMGGQTVVTEGVYPHDLERWLKGLPIID